MLQVAGVLHRKNVFRVRSWARVPVCVSRVLHRFLGPLLDVSAPALPKNYGATLELQRIEQEERLEQTMLLANIQQHRSQLLSNRIRDQVNYLLSFLHLLVLVTYSALV